MPTPRRIMILGPSGAGKSTLAKQIGARLEIPVFHMDRLYWQPGWKPPEPATFRARVAEAASGEAWVIDGNYSNTFELRLPRAEAVIWLDLPRYVYFPRTLWRCLRNYGRTRDDIGPECPERFELAFFRDWVWAHPYRARLRQAALMAALPPGIRGINLHSPGDVRRFTENLPNSFESRSAGGSACN